METYKPQRPEESFLDTLRDAVYAFLPHYELALRGADGSTTPYQTSPLETLAVFMSKGNHGKAGKTHGYIHQTPEMITVPTRGGKRQISRHAHEGSGLSLAQYIAREFKVGIDHARRAIKNCH